MIPVRRTPSPNAGKTTGTVLEIQRSVVRPSVGEHKQGLSKVVPNTDGPPPKLATRIGAALPPRFRGASIETRSKRKSRKDEHTTACVACTTACPARQVQGSWRLVDANAHTIAPMPNTDTGQ